MTKKPDLVVWDWAVVKDACVLHVLKNVEKDYQLRKGISRAASFPENAVYTLDPDFPHNTILVDNLLNTGRRIVASQKLKQFLEQRLIPKVEYLRISVINHKQKPVSEAYYIVHPIEPVECLNLEACKPTWGRVDETSIDQLSALVVDEARVPPDRQIFRPLQFHQVILVRRELAAAIDEAGFTATKWVELEDYKQ